MKFCTYAEIDPNDGKDCKGLSFSKYFQIVQPYCAVSPFSRSSRALSQPEVGKESRTHPPASVPEILTSLLFLMRAEYNMHSRTVFSPEAYLYFEARVSRILNSIFALWLSI